MQLPVLTYSYAEILDTLESCKYLAFYAFHSASLPDNDRRRRPAVFLEIDNVSTQITMFSSGYVFAIFLHIVMGTQ